METAAGRSLVWSLVLLAGALAAPTAAGQETSEGSVYAGMGARGCLICHGAEAARPAVAILQGPHAVTGNTRAPLADGTHQCETCHGPSAQHLRPLADGTRPPPAVFFGRNQPAAVKDGMCVACHEREAGLHWATSTHSFEEVACTDCHTVHTARDPALTAGGEAAVCYQCHERERAAFLRHSAHPVGAALMQCTDCHAPHGSAGPALLARPSVNETCYDCHAEKRGPFLWEHAPVREDCTNCHVPHGSNHANLLQARTPWLCQQCHLAQFHPSTALSGANVPPFGASHLVLAQSCTNCHTRVHGSNHPSGARLTR